MDVHKFAVIKLFVLFGCLVALINAQRPFYAGSSPKVYPELASRFKDTSSSSSDSNSISSRIGESDTDVTQKVPVDARGDTDLVNWLNSWPRENRPFWLLNADHIERHRGSEDRRNQLQQFRSRSSLPEYPLFREISFAPKEMKLKLN